MNQIFKAYLRKFVLVFFDDILVYSRDWETHLLHLQQALRVLSQQQFIVNQKKCNFGQQQVEYLGHVISGLGVTVDRTKVKNVVEWPVPRNVKGVKGFLGQTGYYRKFIKDYGKMVKPLTELTKKDGFYWGPEAAAAFKELKRVLTSASLLTLPDFTQPFQIECDASGRGIGAVLMQNQKPIAYFSKALSATNLSKFVYEKEFMALVLSVQHWRHYLIGKSFIVFTDQKSLKNLLQQRVASCDQQCWISKLLGYQFEVIYKPGPEYKVVDSLSRMFEEKEECKMLISSPVWEQREKIQEEVLKDPTLKKVLEDVTKDPLSRPGFHIHHETSLYKNRVVIPSSSDLIPLLL